MKKVIFILQAKGGVGKSTLAYLIANKYLMEQRDRLDQVKFVDLDNTSKSTTEQLKFISPVSFNLTDAVNKRIDRSLFIQLIESFIEAGEKHFICDFGATSSEQFLRLLENDEIDFLSEVSKSFSIKFEFICVISGGNSFSASVEYLEELKTVNKNHRLMIAQNMQFPISDSQKNVLKTFKNYPTFTFNILKEDGQQLEMVKEIMAKGMAAIDELTIVARIRFKSILKQLAYDTHFEKEKKAVDA